MFPRSLIMQDKSLYNKLCLVISLILWHSGCSQGYRPDVPNIIGFHSISTNNHFGEDFNVTVTQISTVDTYVTSTVTYYNSVPVTLTDFVKTTVTLPTKEVLHTAVDDVVALTSVEVTRPSTQTVTDVNTGFSCVTEVSTEFYTITHVDQKVFPTVFTSTIVQTHSFSPVIIQTQIRTEIVYFTETLLNENTVWHNEAPIRETPVWQNKAPFKRY